MTATTCDTGGLLLRAVLADPASDAARLIYADYLDEQGEADRAEFVRVQCRIATLNAELMSAEDCDATNCPGCGERRELQRRERELWLMAVAEELPARWVLPPPDGFTFRKLPGDEWETDGRPHISQAEYRRGQALGTIYVERKEIRHGTIDSMSKEEVQRKLDELKKLYGGPPPTALIDAHTGAVIASVDREKDPEFVSPVENPPLDVFEMDRDNGEEA